MSGERLGDVIASPRMRPALMWLTTAAAGETQNDDSPAIMAAAMGPPPL